MQRHKRNLQYPIEASKWSKMSRGTVGAHRALPTLVTITSVNMCVINEIQQIQSDSY